MKHTLRLHGVIIGHSDLEEIDPAEGRARGRFRPGLGWELVEPVFALYRRAVPEPGGPADEAMLQRYHQARDAIALQLLDDRGALIDCSAVHIADYSTRDRPDLIELDVLIPDRGYWQRRS
jgi:hypothetical protein